MVALWTAHAQLSRFYLDSTPRGREDTKVRGPGVEARQCTEPSLVPSHSPKNRRGESLGALAKFLGCADVAFSIPELPIRSTRRAFT